MSSLQTDIDELDAMVGKVQSIRNRTCEPTANTDPRYLELSNVVTNLRRAADDIRTEL